MMSIAVCFVVLFPFFAWTFLPPVNDNGALNKNGALRSRALPGSWSKLQERDRQRERERGRESPVGSYSSF